MEEAKKLKQRKKTCMDHLTALLSLQPQEFYCLQIWWVWARWLSFLWEECRVQSTVLKLQKEQLNSKEKSDVLSYKFSSTFSIILPNDLNLMHSTLCFFLSDGFLHPFSKSWSYHTHTQMLQNFWDNLVVSNYVWCSFNSPNKVIQMTFILHSSILPCRITF